MPIRLLFCLMGRKLVALPASRHVASAVLYFFEGLGQVPERYIKHQMLYHCDIYEQQIRKLEF